MKKDYLGLFEVDLGTLKSAFLTTSRENILYTDILTTEEIAKYMNKISNLSKEEKLNLVIQKLNDIYIGKFPTEDEVNLQEAIIVLILKSIPFTKDEADIYWKNKAKSGIHKETKKVLIEVAAIHPLINGKPGKEFEEHLEKAIELYNEELEKGNNPIIYVPGSLHYVIDQKTGKPAVDSQPLSEAGKKYLLKHGIREESIKANIANLDIKREDGVYNSGDECYIATQIAKDENCGRIISVVSPVQLYRKALFYQEFGYNPELYATGSEETNHNYVGELFWSLYITYMNDQDWQTGFLSYLTRRERDIDFCKKTEEYSESIDAILKNGPGIPQNVIEKKEKWLEIYNNAKKTDEANQSKEGILINLIRTDGKQEQEQKRLLDIITQYPESRVTILYDESTDISDLHKNMEKNPLLQVKFMPVTHINPRIISEEFKNGDYRKLFGIYPSSICMKQSIELIREGIIPIVSTLPDKNPNYIDNISALFDEVMKPIELGLKDERE